MLFVFQVDTGRMMTFDMSLAFESVENLKCHVEKACHIPVDKQVLLISGGVYLEPQSRVCSHAAGTDTNPIFLFSKAVIESDQPPNVSVEYGSEQEMQLKVREANDMPVTYGTVQKRAHLSHMFFEMGQEQVRICEKLVHEQHLQQQGWSAVVANLEDLSVALRHRWELYQRAFHQYIQERNSYLDFLQCFKDDLRILQKIPVLPALIDSQKLLVPESDAVSDDKESISAMAEMSLFDWITQRDDFMDCLYENCNKGLHQTDENLFEQLKEEVEEKLAMTENATMKEVKGLGDRLFGLEKLMVEARRYVSEQMELAKSFKRNNARASQFKEASVLPDLCMTHLQQLNVMLDNHNCLRDITRRCICAKNELSSNLYHRLKWVVFMEDNISELDNKLVFNFQNLISLQRQLDILQQVHTAPTTYVSAIAEVVRRRAFSQAFLLWASDIACHLLTIHNEELSRRKDFQAQFDGHFLSSLFPGMEDLPPSFATQAPSIFDSALPKLSQDDIDKLKTQLPELAEHFNVPNSSSVINYLMFKDGKDVDKIDEGKPVDVKLIEVVNEAGLASNLDQNLLKAIKNEASQITPLLKDLDKGCESETDTEEFEKVSQSPFELHFDAKGSNFPRAGTQDASTLTEVGDKNPLPPKKPPRTFQKSHPQDDNQTATAITMSQRTLSISGSQSNTESFTNIKNPSLESIDELSSLKNFTSNTESCFNSHHQQMQCCVIGGNGSSSSILLTRSKSISPQSPKGIESPNSPVIGHQPNDFVNDEFYIDESLPSSLSIEAAGQSQGELFVKQLDTANNVVALLQDNLQISRTEYEKLKSVLVTLSNVAKQTHSQLKSELTELKNYLLKERVRVEETCGDIFTNINNITIERDIREREIVQRITVDHELEICDFRKIAQGKNEEIKTLRDEIAFLTKNVKETTEENAWLKQRTDQLTVQYLCNIDELNKQIETTQDEKEKAVKEVGEKLKSEHKAELENIRQRFKLMTMERSPSENSLEKIERGDYSSSIANHEALLIQLSENFESEKEVAISDAVLKESQKWQKTLNETVMELSSKHAQDREIFREEIEKRIVSDKDKQIDTLTDQIRNLSLECLKLKSTIQQLTECNEESINNEYLKKIDVLEREKHNLQHELDQFKSNPSINMAASVAVCQGAAATCDSATSPIKQKRRLESLTRGGKQICIDTCKNGDLVLVVWEPSYQNYKILQQTKTMHFLNSDCMEALGLKLFDGQPNLLHCFAEVVEKEYCHAKKPVNRFRVPQGTKFFRVKVKPPFWISGKNPNETSQIQITSTSSVEVCLAEGSPSSPTNTEPNPWKFDYSQPTTIPEELGEDFVTKEIEKSDDDVEKATELTEMFSDVDR